MNGNEIIYFIVNLLSKKLKEENIDDKKKIINSKDKSIKHIFSKLDETCKLLYSLGLIKKMLKFNISDNYNDDNYNDDNYNDDNLYQKYMDVFKHLNEKELKKFIEYLHNIINKTYDIKNECDTRDIYNLSKKIIEKIDDELNKIDKLINKIHELNKNVNNELNENLKYELNKNLNILNNLKYETENIIKNGSEDEIFLEEKLNEINSLKIKYELIENEINNIENEINKIEKIQNLNKHKSIFNINKNKPRSK